MPRHTTNIGALLGIKAVQPQERPHCRNCIHWHPDFRSCHINAPLPMVMFEDMHEHRYDYTLWPTAGVSCSQGEFLVGEPPDLEIIDWYTWVEREIDKENYTVASKQETLKLYE